MGFLTLKGDFYTSLLPRTETAEVVQVLAAFSCCAKRERRRDRKETRREERGSDMEETAAVRFSESETKRSFHLTVDFELPRDGDDDSLFASTSPSFQTAFQINRAGD